MISLLRLAACCLLGLSGGALAAQTPAPATVGDPQDPGALARQVQDAYANGARSIIVRPGTYVMPAAGHSAITLQGWHDATLSASHVTLILTDLAWMHDGVDVTHCTHVTVQGLTLSQNNVTAYQGRVLAVGKDADGKPYADWRPDAGYPVPPDTDKKGFLGGDVDVVDAQTRLLKVGDGDHYGVRYEPRGDGVFRAHMDGHSAPGDWLVGRCGDAPFKVYVHDSRNCTIQDVTMMRNGFAPLREDGGGGNHYLHCVWALGPPPGSATELPLVTNAADGMHMTGSYPGPDIEGCVMTGVFLDDCIAIHGSFSDVTAVSGNVVTVKDNQWNAGDPIQLADSGGDCQNAKVVALSKANGGGWNVTLDAPAGIRFLEAPGTASVSGDPINSKATNPLRNGAGFKITGCRLGGTRSRGLLLKGGDGLVRGNIIRGCGMSAVSIGPEFYWNEAGYVRHVVVEHNQIIGSGACGDPGAGTAVFVHGDGAMGNQNIVIRNNRFVSNFGGEVGIAWAKGVVVKNNIVTRAAALPAHFRPQPVITLANCQGVLLSGNRLPLAPADGPPLVAVKANATDITSDVSDPL